MIERNKKIKATDQQNLTPYGRYIKKVKVTHEQLCEMYAIYKDYYQNTQFSIFENDFGKKQGAIIIFHPITNKIVGFSTVDIQHFKYQTKQYTVLFSGDTVVQKEFWGARTLQSTMMKLLIKLRIQYASHEFYWLLISKGYKTYLTLTNNCYVYYPHMNGENQQLAPVVETYCRKFFPEYFDEEAGLLNFGSDYQPLKQDVAPITEQMRFDNPKISFFEEKNPTWHLGTELPCIGRLSWTDLARYPFRLMTKATSKGKLEYQKHTHSLESRVRS